MNKALKILAIISGLILFLWVTGRVTGAIQVYDIPTRSNEPNLKLNTIIFVSNLKTPKRGDLVVYNSKSADSAAAGPYKEVSKSDYIHRLCAFENDTILMKERILYVNGKNVDAKINLYHFYEIPTSALDALAITDKDREMGNIMDLNESVSLINLTTENISNLPPNIKVREYNMPSTMTDGVFKWHPNSSEWTVDNFGPIIIPAAYGFVLGDNRHNSLDSRYTGFIQLKHIKGVKL